MKYVFLLFVFAGLAGCSGMSNHGSSSLQSYADSLIRPTPHDDTVAPERIERPVQAIKKPDRAAIRRRLQSIEKATE